MSRQIEIAEYKKNIADLTRQYNAIQTKKERLLLALQYLNINYQQGRIGYLEYSHSWSEILRNRPAEEYVADYDRRLYELASAKATYTIKIRALETEGKRIAHTLTLAASIMIILAMVAGFGITSYNAEITGAVTQTVTTISNASISAYISIAMSGNLTNGIIFGSLNVGSQDNNATDNYNASDMAGYYIALSSDSNVNVDFCIKANDDLMNGTTSFGIGNMTWRNATSTDINTPSGPDGSYVTSKTTYGTGDTNVIPGGDEYYRFWLDVPADQAAGNYNNTIDFKAVQTGTGC